ncbi:hypothetical protein FRC02_003678 [Tulasnella sp. 418]|nr:hypothetical protein FRC02_003678 [Tulasnella sp. 418]
MGKTDRLSRNAPLDISIWSANGRHTSLRIFRIEIILSIVTPHLHRCRSLQICLKPKGIRLLSNQFTPRSMPALEKLDLEVLDWFSMFVGWRCRIRSASLAGLRSWKTDIQLLPLMSFVPHMDNLKTLHLTSVILSPRFAERCAGTLQEILYILSRSPNLEQFTMTLRRPLRSCSSSFSAPSPVSLPHLISLEVITNDNRHEPTIYALPILESIHAPELEIIGSGGICSNIIPLIASSNPFPALKDLTLSHQRWLDNEMGLDQIESLVTQLAFSNLPLLTSLTLKSQILTSQIIQILGNSFPRLITLSLSLCRFEPSGLIEMVKARTTPAILTKLEILKIKATAVVTLSEKDQHTLHKTLPEFVYMPPEGKYPVQTQRRD